MKVLMTKPQTSWPVSIGWLILTISMSIILITAFNTSVWFYRHSEASSNGTGLVDQTKEVFNFGLSGYCQSIRVTYANDVTICKNFGGTDQFQFSFIPDPWWKAAYVLFGCGSIFFGYSAICAMVCQFLPSVTLRKSVAHYTGYVQVVGGKSFYGDSLQDFSIKYPLFIQGKYRPVTRGVSACNVCAPLKIPEVPKRSHFSD